MPMMTRSNQKFVINWRVERSHDGAHAFCQVLCDIEGQTIGNPDAWSVLGLMTESISDLANRLKHQASLKKKSLDYLAGLRADDLFTSLYSWQWEGNWIYQENCPLPGFNADNFFALPIGTEVFDGESAYLIFAPNRRSRFIWRDYESKKINEHRLDFDDYLNNWGFVENDLARCSRTP